MKIYRNLKISDILELAAEISIIGIIGFGCLLCLMIG